MNQSMKTTIALASLAICATSHAATIFDNLSNELTDPSITTSAPRFNGTFDVSNVFDDNLSNTYGTGGVAADAFIDFDFSAATIVGGFVFAQRGTTGYVTDFDLIFSNNADFTAPVATLNFATTGTPDFTLAGTGATNALQQFEFASAVNARYVKWEANASNNIYDGAAEMQFWTVPEPSTTALLGLGGLALILRRRR